MQTYTTEFLCIVINCRYNVYMLLTILYFSCLVYNPIIPQPLQLQWSFRQFFTRYLQKTDRQYQINRQHKLRRCSFCFEKLSSYIKLIAHYYFEKKLLSKHPGCAIGRCQQNYRLCPFSFCNPIMLKAFSAKLLSKFRRYVS